MVNPSKKKKKKMQLKSIAQSNLLLSHLSVKDDSLLRSYS